jgi:nucleoside triphosphate diphosphatase
VIDKMQRRHPHLYGLGEQEEWESLKAKERTPEAGVLHGVARGLDPLSKAHRIQDRVAAVGFDWADATGAFEKVAEELEEVREAHGGAAASTPRRRIRLRSAGGGAGGGARGPALRRRQPDASGGAHALTALHGANAKFARRFEALERLAAERGVVLEEASLADLDALWDEIKEKE